MSLSTNIDLSIKSTLYYTLFNIFSNLSFLVDFGITSWFSNGEKQPKEFLSKNLKSSLPKNTLFDISSLVFNFQTRQQEILSSYTCFYDSNNDIICVMFDEKCKHCHFTKEVMENFMELANKIAVKEIIILLCNKNKEYVNLLMDMMTYGFQREENKPTVTMGGKTYKVLRMKINEIPEEIEEVEF